MEDCQFAVIDREQWLEIVHKKEGRIRKSRMEMFQVVPFFQHLTKLRLQKMVDEMQDENFIRNQVVFSKGQRPTHLYIVLDGEFEIYWNSKSKYSLMNLTKKSKLHMANNLSRDKLQ